MEERLQKILSRAGIASRRAAEKMLVEGRISVNGAVVWALGAKADATRDEIRVDGRLVSLESEKIYLVLHKPSGVVTTLSDPQGRPIVTALLAGVNERVYPVGRLDYDSEGLLILTNDGAFAQQIQHPRYGIPKTYRVKVEGRLPAAVLRSLDKGVALPDGLFKPTALRLEKTNQGSTWLSLTLTDGRNRVIRRGFAVLGHDVLRIIRVAVADIALSPLKAGEWRLLTAREVATLREFAQSRE
ncbi:MAG: rRNA pseudouridine synthase, partial [Syntrophaceae bacterium]|nr:rRNA pseudouridine synthase [Syntrophaceae bacterium]